MTKVPSGLIGKSKDEAVDELQKNGFAVEINTENSSQPENTVTRIEPNEGTSVERGASVTIWVSNGKVAVPNVVGVHSGKPRPHSPIRLSTSSGRWQPIAKTTMMP